LVGSLATRIIDLRPVYHRREERIRAHVVLCWLALLLIRVIETTTGDTWPNVRRRLDRLHMGTFTGPVGCSASAPRCPSLSVICWPSWASRSPSRSSNSARQAADQQQYR
jgi:hypothetical protein